MPSSTSPTRLKAKEQPRPSQAPTPEPEDRVVPWSEDDARFWKVASALLLLGVALRQWQLDAFPFHPDEAIHGWYAFGFSGYRYDPVFHGPLLYHLVASTFQFFGGLFKLLHISFSGDNDFTARLVPSVLGIGLLFLVLGPARRWQGGKGALWSLGLLAISPVMVTYSRRLLHDALVLVLTLGAVLCFQVARENSSRTPQGRRARIGLCALMSLFVATKANAFFILAMLVAFWVAEQISRLAFFQRFAPRDDVSPAPDPTPLRGTKSKAKTRATQPIVAAPRPWWERAEPWVPLGALAVVALFAHFALRDPAALAAARGRGEFVLSERTFSIICVLASGALWLWLLRGPRVVRSEERDAGSATEEPKTKDQRPKTDFVTPLLAIGAALFLFAFLFGSGHLWLQDPASIPMHLREVFSLQKDIGPLRRMIDYWGGQQAKPRLPGPHDYYIVLAMLYELPILLAGLLAIARACRERTPWTDLLVWWAGTSFILYALANEKVPWLLAHILMPILLLAGWWLGKLELRANITRQVLAGATALGAIYLLRGTIGCNFERAADHHEPLLYAQPSNEFKDAFFSALKRENAPEKAIWIAKVPDHPEWVSGEWPAAWHLRADSQMAAGSSVEWGAAPVAPKLRAIVLSPEQWATKDEPWAARYNFFQGWNDKLVPFNLWPRASWPALHPDVWGTFWWNRVATVENGVLAPPGEWSQNALVVATPSR